MATLRFEDPPGLWRLHTAYAEKAADGRDWKAVATAAGFAWDPEAGAWTCATLPGRAGAAMRDAGTLYAEGSMEAMRSQYAG